MVILLQICNVIVIVKKLLKLASILMKLFGVHFFGPPCIFKR